MENERPNPKEITRNSYHLEDVLINLNRELSRQANLAIKENRIFQKDLWLNNEEDTFGIIIVDKCFHYEARDSVTGELRRGLCGAEEVGSLSRLVREKHPFANHYIDLVKRWVKNERTAECLMGNLEVHSPTAYLPPSWNIPITDEIRYFVYDRWRVDPKKNTHLFINYFYPNGDAMKIIFPNYLLGGFFQDEWTIEMCNELNKSADRLDEYKKENGICRLWDGIQRKYLPYNVKKVAK